MGRSTPRLPAATLQVHKSSSPWQMFWRPMLVASVALHALVLGLPIASEPEPEATEEVAEEPPVSLASLRPVPKVAPPPQPTPTATPPRPKVQPARPTPVPRPSPNPVPRVAPSPSPVASPSVEPTPQASPTPEPEASPAAEPTPISEEVPLTPEATAALPAELTAEEQELQDLWGQFQGNLAGVAASETAGLNIPYYKFPQPELFFTAESIAAAEADPSLAAASLPMIDNILWASRRRPDEVLAEVQQMFEGFTFTPEGEYGGGDLYKMEKEGTIRYINLVRASDRSATFVVIWKQNPNQPAS
ncbi:hypothetical protein HNI00_19740 [Thermoleptolyngbya oregonensis NK1-22]|uniref:Uncharacterized protein n=1 Tax=Thermoleptolyngbya oregonensis NK1-22 TaxID=2547457 RepID=A0AA96YRM4_9CYAN|nr:hypothetical protein [Thermoleptolyngbya oregonensis]WOB45127.1 hypothetical protein HNI00_19740 [Thermoleptolyngbya oregonensis NK1-22]